MGPVAENFFYSSFTPQYLNFQTREQTLVTCSRRVCLNHWTTRKDSGPAAYCVRRSAKKKCRTHCLKITENLKTVVAEPKPSLRSFWAWGPSMTALVTSPWSWSALVTGFERSLPQWDLNNSNALWHHWTQSLEISADTEWQRRASLPSASGQWCWYQGAVPKWVGRQAAWAKVLFLEAPATHLRVFPEA